MPPLKNIMTTKIELSTALTPIVSDFMSGRITTSDIDDMESGLSLVATECRKRLGDLKIDEMIETLRDVLESVAPEKTESNLAILLVSNVRMRLKKAS